MNSQLKKIIEKPFLILIAVNILVGLFIFQDYGTSWDEPHFYSYGDALGYAYSPTEWFSGHFDLYNSYGASGDDHKNRGPAYLFLARNFVYGLTALGSDIIPAGGSTSAWHLVNFLFFQLSIYFLYRFSTRWMNKSAAFFTAVFFSTQPLLWGHSFINPKDPPFLTFFLGSVCLGFEMVDAIAQNTKERTRKILIASFFLGIATSIRVLGPLAGLIVITYSISKITISNLRVSVSQWFKIYFTPIFQYGLLSILVMFITWPFLWEDPLKNFVNVFLFMSDNPTQLAVLFGDDVYRAGDLPRSYMPFMLATTLTEPTWILFVIGVMAGYWKSYKARRLANEAYRNQLVYLSLTLAWFVILVLYVLVRKPAMYDGIRHFLFILPPVFIFSGLAFQFLVEKINSWTKTSFWLHAILGLIFIIPGIRGITKLHPYEYTYYNLFVGGTSGVFRSYETEFWLTCYKDAVEELKDKVNEPINLFVKREAYLAEEYADENIFIRDLRIENDDVQPRDYVLVNTRTNEDMSTFGNAPPIIEIERLGAKFCIVRQIP